MQVYAAGYRRSACPKISPSSEQVGLTQVPIPSCAGSTTEWFSLSVRHVLYLRRGDSSAFREKYGAKYARGVACLAKDTEALLAFYDFPAEHWDHLRTSNPIESVFATVRYRTVRIKGALSQKTAKLMVFTLVRAASRKWRRLNDANQLPRVIERIKFTDGVAEDDTAQSRAA